MAKVIPFESEGISYKLGFTRYTAKKVYSLGFHIELISTNPIEAVELLAYGAFLKNHPTIKRQRAVELIGNLAEKTGDGDGIIACLLEMLNEAMEETVLKKTGNVEWQMVEE